MKILILANDDEGLYQFRKELLVELLKHHEVYASVPEGPYKDDLIKLGCTLKLIPFNRRGVNPFNDLRLCLQYVSLLKDVRPDIVFTYTIKPNVYGGMVCRLLRVPYVVNITGLGTAVENEGILQKISILLYKVGVCAAQQVFFQNEDNRDFMLSRGIVKGRYDMIPGSGVNLTHFKPLDYPKDDIVVFSFISRIMKEKGIEQYLEAAKYIRKKYPNTQFHVCGYCEQDYQEELSKLHKAGIIVYHGCIRDVREMHKISHCTIHPTYYPEGLSNVLLESLSCCRPIMTTNRSGCREIVDDGVNGFVVRKMDSLDLIEKIEKFLALPYDEKRKLGLNGRKKVERKFSRQIVVDKYVQELSFNK